MLRSNLPASLRIQRLAGVAVICGALCICLTVASVNAGPTKGNAKRSAKELASIQKQQTDLRARFESSMAELAKHCRETNQPAQATRIELLAKPVDPQTVRFAPLPRNVRPELPADLSAEERYIESQLFKHRSEYAKGLYFISRQAVNAGFFGLAYDLVCETARHDSDHAAARSILGYAKLGDEWLSPFERKMRKDNKVWTPKYGWLLAKDKERYETGERYFNRNGCRLPRKRRFAPTRISSSPGKSAPSTF